MENLQIYMKLQAIIAAAVLASGCSGSLFCKASTVEQYQTDGRNLRKCHKVIVEGTKHCLFVDKHIPADRCIELSDDYRQYSWTECPKKEPKKSSSNIDRGWDCNDRQGGQTRGRSGYSSSAGSRFR